MALYLLLLLDHALPFVWGPGQGLLFTLVSSKLYWLEEVVEGRISLRHLLILHHQVPHLRKLLVLIPRQNWLLLIYVFLGLLKQLSALPLAWLPLHIGVATKILFMSLRVPSNHKFRLN